MDTSNSRSVLRFRLFGGFKAFLVDTPLPSTRTRKEEWLLALLMLRHAAPVERTWLAYLFWPDSIEERALQNLRRSLNDLRRVLGRDGSRLLSPTPRTLLFDVSGLEIDVLDFDRAVAQGGKIGCEEAVALYAGALLEGCDEDWLAPERALREAAYLRALETLADDSLSRLDYSKSIGYLRHVLAVEPGRETTVCTLLTTLASCGDAGGVVEAYRQFREYLHRELNAAPSLETEALYRQLRSETGGKPTAATASSRPLSVKGRGVSGTAPSLLGKETGPMVPRVLTPMIGREQELAELDARLRHPDVRLVTITGFGGMGKTRLANRIAEQLTEDPPILFCDGVWWLEMEEAASGEAVLARIAERLRLPILGEGSVRGQVSQALRDRRLLLVLDNLEQVPDAAETVRDLLAEAPAVKCLVTSRRVLGVRGEHVLELNSLPDLDAEALFMERAREGKSDFLADRAGLDFVKELCRRLEGVPLALELAAARSVLLSPREMLDRLNERFRLLQSRSPDLPLRRRALHAAIEWSYDLLPGDARAVLAQLSVFAGGFTLDDAEAVCEAADVMESVEILRRHSFFRVELGAAEQKSRFLMLESVRQFAAARLRETKDRGEGISVRHARRYLVKARALLASLRTSGEIAALKALEADSGNLRAAVRWALETGKCAPDWLASRLSLALGQWRHRRGFVQEAVEAIESGLASLCPEAPADLRADLLRERAGLHLDLGETRAARLRAEEAWVLGGAMGDTIRQAKAENLLGQADMFDGAFPEARARFTRALNEFKRAGLDVEVANVRTNLGVAERRDISGTAVERDARLQAAEQHLEEALRLRRALEDKRGLAETLNSLGALAFERGEMDRAETHYREGLLYERELQNTLEVALLLSNLGEVADRRGNGLEAVRLFLASERLLGEVRSPLQSVVAGMASRAASEHGLGSQVLGAIGSEVAHLPASALFPGHEPCQEPT